MFGDLVAAVTSARRRPLAPRCKTSDGCRECGGRSVTSKANRNFVGGGPSRLVVADLTDTPLLCGAKAFVALVIDAYAEHHHRVGVLHI